MLRPQGRFVAFDPNRMNPFMWLYRDRASPFYSSLGVTENERPVLAHEVLAVFERTGFTVSSHYLSGLAYRYVASPRARLLLPVYNFIDAVVFGLGFMERLRPFVLTVGTKPFDAARARHRHSGLQRRPQHRGDLCRPGAARDHAGARADLLRPCRRRHAAGDPATIRRPMPVCRSTFVRNAGRGAHSAVMTGFAASTAPFVLMYPADDHTNAPMLDPMVALARGGLRHRLRQPLHAGRRHGRLPAAQGGAGAHRQLHAAASGAASRHRRQQRLSACSRAA